MLVAALLCGCGAKAGRPAAGGSTAGVGIAASSPGHALVDAYKSLVKGDLEPLMALTQLPDTNPTLRAQLRTRYSIVARQFQRHHATCDFVSENVTGDLATVVMHVGGMNDNGTISEGKITAQMIRTDGVWYLQTQSAVRPD